jgi:hypothetical protein
MPAVTITPIMLGLETRLKTISGLRTSPYVPDQITPPHAVIEVPPIDYHTTFAHGMVNLTFTIRLFAQKVIDRIDQPTMAAFADIAGTNSIHAAIEGDKTLGGVADDCKVISFDPVGGAEVGALPYYEGVFTVRVLGKGA